jgi:hypothetical protein
VLERLFAAKGLAPGTWWTFLVQGEGKTLPGGLESLSGFVLTRGGEVYGWWLDWEGPSQSSVGPDAAGGGYALDRWWPVAAPQREFRNDAEYRVARRQLGLGAGGPGSGSGGGVAPLEDGEEQPQRGQ